MPNELLRMARERMPSRTRSGKPTSRSELAKLVVDYLGRRTNKQFPFDANYVGKLERGEIRWPCEEYREALRVVLGADEDSDLGFFIVRDMPSTSAGSTAPPNASCEPFDAPAPSPPTSPGIRARVARTAHESQAFWAQWESRYLSPQTVEELAEDLSRLSAEYVHEPLAGLFDELVSVRDRAYGLLRQQRRTSDMRGLLSVAGLACGMLAHACVDLGDRRSAACQARVASRLASEAGHNGLLAWIYGTQSLIAYCLRMSDKAVEFAERGQAYATSTTSRVRLAALKARGYAARRNGPAAHQALAEARAARDNTDLQDDLDIMGGILGFPFAKQNYYAASTAALLSDGTAAESHAQQAICAYETGPEEERSYGDLALSRVYLAHSRLLKPASQQDPAAAADAIRDVLALPPEQRIAGLQRPLHRIQADLDREPVSQAIEARQLKAEIAEFLTGTHAIAST